MAEADNWIATGDRSHPTLKLVDELKELLTYDGYREDLQKLETAHLDGDDFKVDGLKFYVQESQRILHDGDRSHPRLVKLDSIRGTLTYDGWEEDFDEALSIHISREDDLFDGVERCLKKMKHTQRMSNGDYSHPNLKFLFSLELTFPGWEDKLEEAVNHHKNGWDTRIVDYHRYSLAERQRVFEGVRSHERLVALDELVLTYPDWEKDVKEIEKNHLDDNCWYNYGVSDSFIEKLNFLEGKQTAYEAEDHLWRYHPILKEILSMEWTYPGFEDDLDEVRAEDPTSSDYTFRNLNERCTISQMIHDGNFEEHEALVKLNELVLSYPGWEQDFEEAKDILRQRGYNSVGFYPFDNHMKGMENKQVVYEGSKKAEEDKKKADNPSKHLGSCAICFEAPQTHVFVPCGHVCACKQCSTRVMAKNKKCPICNKVSKMTMELFFC